jgi:hypothetical protein
MKHILCAIDVHLSLKVVLEVILAEEVIFKAHFNNIGFVVSEVDVVAH